MNYQETTEWLFNQLPMFQNQGAIAYKNDLSNIVLLDTHLNHPHHNFKTIHVAGTNGKGSTSSLLASVLQEAGYKVGLYTSPHLKDFRERIRINGEVISEEFVVDFVSQHQSFFESHDLSFFEMTVGMAFDYFFKEKVDVAVIEVGMGGRLDATNIITPLVSVITNIGFDHVQFLGDTLAKIAFEKAGIIKENVPVIIGETTAETRLVFQSIADKKHTVIFFAEDNQFLDIPCALLGDYQYKNKQTVLQTLEVLKNHLKINPTSVTNGFLNVVQNTCLLGRWQQINDFPKVICDTAHNVHGLKIVLNQIQNEQFEQLHFVLGFVNDKNLDEILPLFPKNAFFYFSKPNVSRGLDEQIVYQKALDLGLNSKVFSSIPEAYDSAKQNAHNDDFIYIGGSTFVVAEII